MVSTMATRSLSKKDEHEKELQVEMLKALAGPRLGSDEGTGRQAARVCLQ